jgi:hypothetical protein
VPLHGVPKRLLEARIPGCLIEQAECQGIGDRQRSKLTGLALSGDYLSRPNRTLESAVCCPLGRHLEAAEARAWPKSRPAASLASA